MVQVSGKYTTPFPDSIPGPHITVRISSGDGSGTFRDLPGRLDTGADITLVPAHTIAALGLQIVTDDLELHDGMGRVSAGEKMYRADIGLGTSPETHSVGVASTGAPIVLVGLDVLNDYVAEFDGPTQVFKMR